MHIGVERDIHMNTILSHYRRRKEKTAHHFFARGERIICSLAYAKTLSHLCIVLFKKKKAQHAYLSVCLHGYANLL